MSSFEHMTIHQSREVLAQQNPADQNTPVLICLLGTFRILTVGQPTVVRGGGKIEALLCNLALRQECAVPRETLLQALWPDSDATLASQSLHSLIHCLTKSLGQVIGGAPPIINENGSYRLNIESGIGVDILCFDALAASGDHLLQIDDSAAAAERYTEAVHLYKGDLSTGSDMHSILERERLRALYLRLLAHIADQHYRVGNYAVSLQYASRLLMGDPCQEDAHRVVMRCYMRLGQRSQALRHYRLCEQILRAEFDTLPEPATIALFEQIRLNPCSV